MIGFLIAALTALFIHWLSRHLGRSQPAALSKNEGTIRPDLWSAWLVVLLGSGICVLAVWAAIYSNGGVGAVITAFIFAAIAGFMAPSLTSLHTVHWTDAEIEGPARMFGPTLGIARTKIEWGDIVRIGTTHTGYWYVEAADGRRVYWSYLYKGHEALATEIKNKAPGPSI